MKQRVVKITILDGFRNRLAMALKFLFKGVIEIDEVNFYDELIKELTRKKK